MSSFCLLLSTLFLLSCIFVTEAIINRPSMINSHFIKNYHNEKNKISNNVILTAAVLPGNPVVTGTVSLGLINAIGLYSNVMLFRFALSWFPQLVTQFPILRPVFTVTEPYLRIFRSQIPPVAGFDISAIPALFCLNILSQTAAAVGAEIPEKYKTVNNSKNRKGTRSTRRIVEIEVV